MLRVFQSGVFTFIYTDRMTKLKTVEILVKPNFKQSGWVTDWSKKVSEYDQKIPQSQTADREEEPHSNHKTPGRQTKQSNQLSLPHQDDCKNRRDIKKRTTKHRTISESNPTMGVTINNKSTTKEPPPSINSSLGHQGGGA